MARMEHRCSPRIPIELDVMLCLDNKPVAPARTRDIALTGMFLELKHAIFREHSALEVEFTRGVEGEARYSRVHGNEGVRVDGRFTWAKLMYGPTGFPPTRSIGTYHVDLPSTPKVSPLTLGVFLRHPDVGGCQPSQIFEKFFQKSVP